MLTTSSVFVTSSALNSVSWASWAAPIVDRRIVSQWKWRIYLPKIFLSTLLTGWDCLSACWNQCAGVSFILRGSADNRTTLQSCCASIIDQPFIMTHMSCRQYYWCIYRWRTYFEVYVTNSHEVTGEVIFNSRRLLGIPTVGTFVTLPIIGASHLNNAEWIIYAS